jgi:predicted negative regulator of RcsB-dependent stress response
VHSKKIGNVFSIGLIHRFFVRFIRKFHWLDHKIGPVHSDFSASSRYSRLRRKLSRGITPSLAPPNQAEAAKIQKMPTLTSTDPVIETQVFWDRHKKEVYVALVIAFLAVVAWGGYRLYSDRRDATAATLLTTAKTAADFQKVIAQYPNTAAGESACLFLAEEQRKEKKFSEANVTLQSFVDKNSQHEMKGTARMAMAANLESLGKPDEALSVYQRLAADDPQGFIAPIAMISEVHILKDKNQIEEARRVCEAIMTKYRDSLVTAEATRQLRLLKGGEEPAKPAAPPVTPDAKIPPFLLRPMVLPTAAPTAPSAAISPAQNTPATRLRSKRRR